MIHLARWLLIFTTLIAASGCQFLRARTGCHADQPYLHARQLAPLRVPAGLDAPNTSASMVIPEVANDFPPRGPKDPCLDEPPSYKVQPGSKPQPRT